MPHYDVVDEDEPRCTRALDETLSLHLDSAQGFAVNFAVMITGCSHTFDHHRLRVKRYSAVPFRLNRNPRRALGIGICTG